MKSTVAKELVTKALRAAASAGNETQLRHEIEKVLETACAILSVPWTPFQLDRSLRGNASKIRFVDVAHGAVVIEYEPPQSFGGMIGAKLKHARQQVEEYAQLLAEEEGRPLHEYVLVAWDGSHINFGRLVADARIWETLMPFDQHAATRLLTELQTNGIPLVHPKLLANLAGPDSEFGAKLIPLFFSALKAACASTKTSKTKLLFTEWRACSVK